MSLVPIPPTVREVVAELRDLGYLLDTDARWPGGAVGVDLESGEVFDTSGDFVSTLDTPAADGPLGAAELAHRVARDLKCARVGLGGVCANGSALREYAQELHTTMVEAGLEVRWDEKHGGLVWAWSDEPVVYGLKLWDNGAEREPIYPLIAPYAAAQLMAVLLTPAGERRPLHEVIGVTDLADPPLGEDVIRLVPSAPPPPQPPEDEVNQALVDLLTLVLEQAKAGQATSGIVLLDSAEGVATHMAMTQDAIPELFVSVCILKRDILELVAPTEYE